MGIPKYTEEAYWNDVIQQYIDGEPSIRMRHDIEYHIWEYFKDCLRQKIDSSLIIRLFLS